MFRAGTKKFKKLDLTPLREQYPSFYIYDTPSNGTAADTKINLVFPQQSFHVNLFAIIYQGNAILNSFSVKEKQSIFALIKCTISEYSSLVKLDSSACITTCYLAEIASDRGEPYLICIAFEETQPGREKAELVALLKII